MLGVLLFVCFFFILSCCVFFFSFFKFCGVLISFISILTGCFYLFLLSFGFLSPGHPSEVEFCPTRGHRSSLLQGRAQTAGRSF